MSQPMDGSFFKKFSIDEETLQYALKEVYGERAETPSGETEGLSFVSEVMTGVPTDGYSAGARETGEPHELSLSNVKDSEKVDYDYIYPLITGVEKDEYTQLIIDDLNNLLSLYKDGEFVGKILQSLKRHIDEISNVANPSDKAVLITYLYDRLIQNRLDQFKKENELYSLLNTLVEKGQFDNKLLGEWISGERLAGFSPKLNSIEAINDFLLGNEVYSVKDYKVEGIKDDLYFLLRELQQEFWGQDKNSPTVEITPEQMDDNIKDFFDNIVEFDEPEVVRAQDIDINKYDGERELELIKDFFENTIELTELDIVNEDDDDNDTIEGVRPPRKTQEFKVEEVAVDERGGTSPEQAVKEGGQQGEQQGDASAEQAIHDFFQKAIGVETSNFSSEDERKVSDSRRSMLTNSEMPETQQVSQTTEMNTFIESLKHDLDEAENRWVSDADVVESSQGKPDVVEGQGDAVAVDKAVTDFFEEITSPEGDDDDLLFAEPEFLPKEQLNSSQAVEDFFEPIVKGLPSSLGSNQNVPNEAVKAPVVESFENNVQPSDIDEFFSYLGIDEMVVSEPENQSTGLEDHPSAPSIIEEQSSQEGLEFVAQEVLPAETLGEVKRIQREVLALQNEYNEKFYALSPSLESQDSFIQQYYTNVLKNINVVESARQLEGYKKFLHYLYENYTTDIILYKQIKGFSAQNFQQKSYDKLLSDIKKSFNNSEYTALNYEQRALFVQFCEKTFNHLGAESGRDVVSSYRSNPNKNIPKQGLPETVSMKKPGLSEVAAVNSFDNAVETQLNKTAEPLPVNSPKETVERAKPPAPTSEITPNESVIESSKNRDVIPNPNVIPNPKKPRRRNPLTELADFLAGKNEL